MKKLLVELTFQVTETCNNGTERTIKKKVYASPFFTDRDGRKRNNSLSRSVPLAIEALRSQHYYNIEFIGSKATPFIFTDDFTSLVW